MHTVLITGGRTGIGKAFRICSRQLKANHFQHAIYEHHLNVLDLHSIAQL